VPSSSRNHPRGIDGTERIAGEGERGRIRLGVDVSGNFFLLRTHDKRRKGTACAEARMTAGLWNSGIQEINAVERLCLPAVVVQFLFATLREGEGDGMGESGCTRVQSAVVSGAVAFECDRDRNG